MRIRALMAIFILAAVLGGSGGGPAAYAACSGANGSCKVATDCCQPVPNGFPYEQECRNGCKPKSTVTTVPTTTTTTTTEQPTTPPTSVPGTTVPTTTKPSTTTTSTLPGPYRPRLVRLSLGAVGLPGRETFSKGFNPDTGKRVNQFDMRDATLRRRFIAGPLVLAEVQAKNPGCNLKKQVNMLNQSNAVIDEKVTGRLAGGGSDSWFFRTDNYSVTWPLTAISDGCGCLKNVSVSPAVAELCGRSGWRPAVANMGAVNPNEGLLTTMPVSPGLTAAQRQKVDAVDAEHRRVGVEIQQAIRTTAAEYGIPADRPFVGASLMAVKQRVAAIQSHLDHERDELAAMAKSELQEVLLTLHPHATWIDWARPWGGIVHLFDVADEFHVCWSTAAKSEDPFMAWACGFHHEQTHDQIANYAPGLFFYCNPNDLDENCEPVAGF